MIWVDVEAGRAGRGGEELGLTPAEVLVLAALLDARGRVVPRRELARRAGLRHANERRCDAVLVGLRRALGTDAVQNVRGRGWLLNP